MNIFDQMGLYWVEIADQDQTQRQVNLLKASLPRGELVLDVACGSGRHLIALAKAGWDMVGLDISRSLLRIAKSRWSEAQVVLADMRFLPFTSKTFEAAVSMDQSMGYLPTAQDDLQSLAELHRTLGRGGVLVVDVFNRERLKQRYKAGGEFKRHEYPRFWLKQTRTVTADGSELHDRWEVQDKADGETRVFEHVARLYTLDGLQELLAQAGFLVRTVHGDYERQSFGADSSRLILVASSGRM
jgi:ubiquinone/menaquinone biosynthesis C-methylase UbiE